jgi:hypothetical protein
MKKVLWENIYGRQKFVIVGHDRDDQFIDTNLREGTRVCGTSISIDLSAIIRLPNPIVKRMNQSSIQTNPKGNPAKRLQYTVPSTKQH